MRGVILVPLLLAGCTATAGCFGPSPHPFLDCPGGTPAGPHALRVEVWWDDGRPAEGACVQAWPTPIHGVLYGRRAGADGVATLHVDAGPLQLEAYVPMDGRGDAAWINKTQLNVTGATSVRLVVGPSTGHMAIV